MLRATPLFLLLALAALADGPQDNVPDKVRPIPPAGIPVAEADRKDLRERLASLGREIAALEAGLKSPAMARLIPDVEVFHKAVRYALEHDEFYTPAEVKLARELLRMAEGRAKQLREGKPVYLQDTGLVVRGFRSRIDGSVQPYGLVVPAGAAGKRRLDVWLHGRGEKLSEVAFLGQRLKDRGLFTPPGAIVLHPYGRYCNAFKFAGEIDVLEAIEHVKQNYPIDDDRVVMRGFSMGGAGCWQFAVHYPDKWVAAAPGAGFSETPRFLDVFQKERLAPTEYEKKLWRLYDCDGYAGNLRMLPTIAYSGEKDRQKQAADVMAEALQKHRIELIHVIGEGAGHNYTPKAKEEIDGRIDQLAAMGRPRSPQSVWHFTYTLRYNRSHWVRIDELAKHWEWSFLLADVVDHRATPGREGLVVHVQLRNVKAFTLAFGPGQCPGLTEGPSVKILTESTLRERGDSYQIVRGDEPLLRSDRSWSSSFRKGPDGKWSRVTEAKPQPEPTFNPRKVHGLQGPIDDAFMDSFLMVRPTGKGWHAKTDAWANAEMARAADQWRKQFRGDARVKDDKAVTADDIAAHNLVLWGDPASNAVLAKVLPKLPITWDSKSLVVGKRTFASEHHAPILIYPNPLNPKRYVVLNSGFTFREYDQLNNARQVPKLPDYAVIDVRTPPNSRYPGKVALADFFDEQWQLPKD
jgi:dienelactone hydrolase